jgi:hypothetical protein
MKTTFRLPTPIIGKAVGANGAPTIVKAVAPVIARLELPLEPTVRSDDINDYSFLLHGEKKIGKSSFSTIPDQPGERVLQLTFDPVRPGLELIQRHMPNWTVFTQWIVRLEQAAKEGDFPYKRVVIDGADIMYTRCQTWSCTKLGIQHPSDEGFAKGWHLVSDTFAAWVDRILALPCGVWFISHSEWKEIDTRTPGVKQTKLVPLISGKGEEIMNGRVDGWLAYVYVEKKRALIILGDERTGAGHDCKGHFLTPTGERVAEIPMGDSEEEAYYNFVQAFNNQQTFTHVGGNIAAHFKKPRIVIKKK